VILKLTDEVGDAVLVNLTNITFMQVISGITRLYFSTTITTDVKETIEEIEQQIKEGGITNGTN